jgi:modulator of FtsH protease HflC
MTRPQLIVYAVVAILALFLVTSVFYVVDQREEAVVVNLGDPVRVVNRPGRPEAGLHMKLPWEGVVKFDRRNVALEAQKEEVTASDQRRLVVDAFVRYRIADPLLFYRTLRDERTAGDRIERLVNSSLRQVLGSATSTEIISTRRDQLMRQTRLDVQRRATASRLGIQVIDVRIRRADLPSDVQESVYRNMQTARQQEAAGIRAAGEQRKREIIAEADREVAVTLATAQQTGETTRGEGDALRTRVYAQSFGRDPSFAAFYRSLMAYEASLADGNTTMVLSPDSAFFKYFDRGPSGGR